MVFNVITLNSSKQLSEGRELNKSPSNELFIGNLKINGGHALWIKSIQMDYSQWVSRTNGLGHIEAWSLAWGCRQIFIYFFIFSLGPGCTWDIAAEERTKRRKQGPVSSATKQSIYCWYDYLWRRLVYSQWVLTLIWLPTVWAGITMFADYAYMYLFGVQNVMC